MAACCVGAHTAASDVVIIYACLVPRAASTWPVGCLDVLRDRKEARHQALPAFLQGCTARNTVVKDARKRTKTPTTLSSR
jgi:hypothetical protein